mmetsp:Transcript_8548/g.12385  ORF Transcript_8548/g.12385 Transcript_8548/m.12385 type:complete len:1568 (+) Transcript_8548:167-4870(+)
MQGFSHFVLVQCLLLARVQKIYADQAKCGTNPLGVETFAWYDWCDGNNYKNNCKVSDTNHRQSCLCCNDNGCLTHNGNYAYYICTHNCDDYPFRVDGECVQCSEGYFFGSSSSGGCSKGGVNPDNPCYYCALTADGGMYQNFVCSHRADLSYSNPSFNSAYGGTLCHKCKSGTYAEQGAQYCQSCPAGQYSEEGSKKCTECLEGTASNAIIGATKCNSCGPGTYQDNKGQTSCKTATPGYYSSKENNSEQFPCQAGQYQPNAGQTSCLPCPTVTYQPNTGQTSCLAVSLGHYVNGEGSPKQYPCPKGSYTNSDQTYCLSCPPGKSTFNAGSTSESACVSCQYGVDPQTFGCLEDPSNVDNICWDAGQLLSLNSSVAVQDLNNLVYGLPQYGLTSLIDQTITTIQQAAVGQATPGTIQSLVGKLQNSAQNWLNALSQNLTNCIDIVGERINTVDMSFIVSDKSLFQYQFGPNENATARGGWLAYWHCSGSTFGCAGDTTSSCPQAKSCFEPLATFFVPLLNYPGESTAFGNDPDSLNGRYTPMYSPTFIAAELSGNVEALLDWEDSVKSFERYTSILTLIASSAKQVDSFFKEAIDATLQVQSVETSTTLQSGYIQGNMFYSQAEYNFNMAYDAAEIVQIGPEYCDADGNCIYWDDLIADCQKEMRWQVALKVIGDVAAFAAALVTPLPKPSTLGSMGKAFRVIGAAALKGADLNAAFPTVVGVGAWDPASEMPPIPPTTTDGTFVNQEYALNTSAWYLEAETNLSEALTVMSPAMWDSIYLQTADAVLPVIESPPNCPKYKSEILKAMTSYLDDVKNMTNYGSAMTTEEVSLVPILGNIATGLATQVAIEQASANITATTTCKTATCLAPGITTAPYDYQSVFVALFYSPYVSATETVLAYIPSVSLLNKQYVASKSILGFCRSYSYQNAGNTFVSSDTPGCSAGADCSSFGPYLPTMATFVDTISSFTENTYANLEPESAAKLNNNIQNFATVVEGCPSAVGQTPNSITKKVQTISINLGSSNFGNLRDGSVRFSLTPSSTLWLKSSTPFDIDLVNPRVVNVQAYWKGVTSPDTMTTSIFVSGPQWLYPDSTGIGTSYHLPPIQDNDQNSIPFTQSNNIEIWAGQSCGSDFYCGTSTYPITVNWNRTTQDNSCFCSTVNQAETLQLYSSNLADYNFLLPSLWSTWNVTADPTLWASPLYNVNEDELELQVVFSFTASSNPTPSGGGPKVCYSECYAINLLEGTSPLVGQEWCDQADCASCQNSTSFANITSLTRPEYCLCNIWNGAKETCKVIYPPTESPSLQPPSSEPYPTKKPITPTEQPNIPTEQPIEPTIPSAKPSHSPNTCTYQSADCSADVLCPNDEYPCCSEYGYCGNGPDYCGTCCQSGCPTSVSSSTFSTVASSTTNTGLRRRRLGNNKKEGKTTGNKEKKSPKTKTPENSQKNVRSHMRKMHKALERHLLPQLCSNLLSDLDAAVIVERCDYILKRTAYVYECDFHIEGNFKSSRAEEYQEYVARDLLNSCMTERMKKTTEFKKKVAKDTKSCYFSVRNDQGDEIGFPYDKCENLV